MVVEGVVVGVAAVCDDLAPPPTMRPGGPSGKTQTTSRSEQ
ncbi:MAG TPA: hypothetical protein VGP15_04600 [Burkholderiales bacterium]|nr:hypothetical protein [Burkholderiales bacterium]